MNPSIDTTAELRQYAVAGIGALLAGTLGMALLLDLTAALQWGTTASLGWLYVVIQAWQRRSLNRPSTDAPAYPTLGKGTELTLLRGLLIATTGGFLVLYHDPRITTAVPALLYSLAAILDRLDGAVARKSHHTSLLGSELDTVFDAMGLLIAPLLAVLYGKVHWSYLLASIAYYWFVGAMAWRTRHGLPNHPLHPSRLRRALAGFQMGFVAVALWPFMHPAITSLAAVAFMLPLLLGFVVDWYVVSGRLEPQHPQTAQYFNSLDWLGSTFLLPVLRVLAILALCKLYTLDVLFFTGIDVHGGLTVLLCWTMALAGGCLLAGLGTRIAALVLIASLAVYAPSAVALPIMLVLVCSTVWLMLLGSGRFSVWQKDDVWVHRQDGAV